MPSVQFTLKDLEQLVGTTLPHDEVGLNKIVAYVKADVESIEEKDGEIDVSIEIKDSNHPDIWCVEGIARALRGFLLHKAPKETRVQASSEFSVIVDKRLRHVRPYIACALVRNIRSSEEALKSWISLQEKMDQTYGRKRRRSSIGYYQADLVKPPLHYTVSRPDATNFVPLGSVQSMSLRQIVDNHPKGIEYGKTVSDHKEWPLLIDGDDKVLSFPPIINSDDLGHVTTDTRNVLVEVTGTNLETVENTLKIVVTTLAERGGKVYSCVCKYSYAPNRRTTPNLKQESFQLSLDYTNNLLGTKLRPRQISEFLKRAGYTVKVVKKDAVTIGVPNHRLDIMHQADVAEDIAIAMDLNTLAPEWPAVFTVGGLAPSTQKLDNIAELMVGLGYQEIMTYSLGSEETLLKKMNRTDGQLIELLNPSMSNYTILRPSILSSLMEFLSNNTHVEYPQKIFEVGRVFSREPASPSRVKDHPRLASATVHSTAGFTEIKQSLDAVFRGLGIEYEILPSKDQSMLEGRTGDVIVKGSSIGIIGEVHPRIVRAWGLSLPVAAFEIDLSGTIDFQP